ncbi:hypothetical protein SAY87_023812 [Trapa incisa]|uniref:Uncharacterized protein n=1 Tax=Trapa incisa TaxID=236973 RepID=A0AAN7L708_9MYRT|nr:hypothetical protein SAY87_023812 [Trapa incisa]
MNDEISSLVPEWRRDHGIEEPSYFANIGLCHNCASNQASTSSFMEFLSHNLKSNNITYSLKTSPTKSEESGHGALEMGIGASSYAIMEKFRVRVRVMH